MSDQPRAVHWDEDLESGAVTWSDGVARFLGETSAPDPDRRWWEERVHPDDLAMVRAAGAAVRTGHRNTWAGDYRIRAAGGWRGVREQMVLVEDEGRPRRIVGTIRDTTPAPAFTDRERRFATFIDQLPLLAWEADADGWIDFYNQRWFEYTGTTPEEMEGWGWARVHHPDDLPRMLRVWRNALEHGLPWEDSFRLRRADGALRWHLSRAFPLRDDRGRIVRWFGSNTDVHEQRLALEEREQLLRAEARLRAEAEAAMREKDAFLAVVSHELRTPLSNVLTRAQLLRQGVTDPKLATGLEKIEQNSLRLERLIEDLLDTSRIISGKLEVGREVVDVARATRTAVEALANHAATRQVTVVVHDATEAAPIVLGSAIRLEQIAINLIGNAIKFSHQGGQVDVAVTVTAAAEILLEVRDQGEGIEPALLPQLFQRFKQGDSSARRRHGGLGLGLSITRQLVAAHGGRVEAESPGAGAGATFRAYFPKAGTDAEAMTARPSAARVHPPVSLAGIAVLGVDDDADARDVLVLALAGLGATVSLAGSASEALERLRIEVPDIILSDLAMPEVDGLGLLERVRSSADPRLRRLPFVAVTAHASVDDRTATLAAGFDAYVAKPFDPGELSGIIASLVRGRRLAT